MTRGQYIELHKNMFWYTPANKKAEISDSLLVETILNDGTLADYKALLQVLGPKHVAEVFFAAEGRQKKNIILRYITSIHCCCRNMFTEILTERQRELLDWIAQYQREYYLMGGTAIALYLGHR